MQDELMRLRQNGAHHGVTVHTMTKDSANEQQQQLHELYDAEARLRQRFTARLDRASELATRSPTLYVHTIALLLLHLLIF